MEILRVAGGARDRLRLSFALLVAIAIALVPKTAQAQVAPLITQGANPLIAGALPVQCGGAIVILGNATIMTAGPTGMMVATPNVARAGIVGVNLPPAPGLPPGTAVIIFDAAQFGSPQQITPTAFAFTKFIYAHECSHLMLHHITNPVQTMETDADCNAAKLLRNQGILSPQEVQVVAHMFDVEPPMPPFYPAGVIRDQNILNCYNTP